MNVNRFFIPVLVLLSLFGAYALAEGTGFWAVSGKALGALTNPADIKGWMTLEQVSADLGIPLDTLLALLGLPADTPAASAFKDLEAIIEVSEARERLAGYLAGEIPAPEPATPTPDETPAPAATPIPQVETHTDGEGGGPTPLPPGVFLPGAEIKGRTTLQEIATNGGIPLDTLLDALGLPADTDPTTAVKDLVGQGNVVEVEDVRAIVTELQNP